MFGLGGEDLCSPYGSMMTGFEKHFFPVLPIDLPEAPLWQVLSSRMPYTLPNKTRIGFMDYKSSGNVMKHPPVTLLSSMDSQFTSQSLNHGNELFQSFQEPPSLNISEQKLFSSDRQGPLSVNGSKEYEYLEVLPDNKLCSSEKHITSQLEGKLTDQGCRTASDLLVDFVHANKCPFIGGECKEPRCVSMKQHLSHIEFCKGVDCRIRCSVLRQLITHYKKCKDGTCGICDAPRLKEIDYNISTCISTTPSMAYNSSDEFEQEGQLAKYQVDSLALSCCERKYLRCEDNFEVGEVALEPPFVASHCEANLGLLTGVVTENSPTLLSTPTTCKSEQNGALPNCCRVDCEAEHQNQTAISYSDVKAKDIQEAVEKKSEVPLLAEVCEPANQVESTSPSFDVRLSEAYVKCIDLKNDIANPESGNRVVESSVPYNSSVADSELDELKRKNPSIICKFSAEGIKDHLASLNKQLQQVKELSGLLCGVGGLTDHNACSLCGIEKLYYEPQPRYCAFCFKRINSRGPYYESATDGAEKLFACSTCYRESPKFTRHISKHVFRKKENYAADAALEWQVECDKCKAWQHMICALFNCELNDDFAKYTCPTCFLEELESGEGLPSDPCSVLGACDLPSSQLSDYIERWVFDRLKEDRQKRAINLGKSVEEVPGVEGLTVRVVSSVKRLYKVQPRLYEFLKHRNYPEEFPYTSKAIILFQNIGGVDVCIFVMYVQEYGSKCPLPNQRHVYISYLDSVKYFQPEIKAANGEALRTFVYHEILISYLDHCKKKGFVSCSLWACPSTKHDDYILYCHPETQKMPKSDKLRGWYLSLINKAIKDNVVVERSNLYDCFLQPSKDWKIGISTAYLPYCENDFWPGEVEKILENAKGGTLGKEEKDIRRLLRIAKREDQKGDPDDILLLHKLKERMRATKEDFIMLYLQEICKYCRKHFPFGETSWACIGCKNFQLCDQCYTEDDNRQYNEKHLPASKHKHIYKRIERAALPDTIDVDPNMESKFFDSRIDFLKHCEENLYQFGTLRRAQYSTMMILYHLHSSVCSACHGGVQTGQAWRCTSCHGYYFCDSCYQKNGVGLHPHKLTKAVRKAASDNRPKIPTEQKNNIRMEDVLAALVHSSTCASYPCSVALCSSLKCLFLHAKGCKIRCQKGCPKCKFVWSLIRTHTSACVVSDCRIPRCKDVKLHLTKKRKREH